MTTIHQLLPWRNWRRGPARSAIGWSAVAALLISCAAISGALLIDLVIGGGRVDSGRLAESGLNEPDGNAVDQHGLAATAARYGDRWEFRPLVALCRNVPWLRYNSNAVVVLCGLLVVIVLLHRAAVRRVSAAAARASSEVALGLRRSIHRQALRLTPGDLDGSEQKASLAMFTSDVDRIGAAMEAWVGRLPQEVLATMLLWALALYVDPRLAVQCLVPVAVAGWMGTVAARRLDASRQLAFAKTESELRLLSEGLRKSRLVCGYSMEGYEQEQFEKHLGRYANEVHAARFGTDWTVWGVQGAAALCIGAAGVFAAARMLAAVNPLPMAAVFLIALALLRVWPLVRMVSELQAASAAILVSGDRITKFLAAIPEVGQAVGARFMEPVSKSIILESVSYQRGGKSVLDQIDLRMAAGTTTAIVSVDPSARRAVAYLLPRFIEPSAGRVLFDSEDTAWGTLESIRAEIVYVGADDPFFTGTVLENLTGGDDRFSLQQATDAAKRAHAHKFIQQLPQGYETVLGEHGEQLDPGQAFRLGIARAELRKPAVLILEEPDAALDDDTKALLDDTYQRILSGRTTVILPTRLSTVRRCDQVVLIHEGRVAAVGPHETLVRQSPLYRHWEYVTFNTPPAAADGRQPAAT